MSGGKYPRIGRAEFERRWSKLPQDKGPRCYLCGGKATHHVHVEVSYFRGDDEVFKACANHTKDARALLARQSERAAIDSEIPDNELPGMWEKADFEGGQEEVRGPDWKRAVAENINKQGAALSKAGTPTQDQEKDHG